MNSFWNDFLYGLSCYRKTPAYLWKHGLLKYNILPAIGSLLLFSGLLTMLYFGAPFLTDLVEGLVGYEEYEFRGSGYLAMFLNFLLTLVFVGSMVALYYFTFKFIMLTILSPYLAFMSEKIEKIEMNTDYPFDKGKFAEDIVRGLKMNLRNGIREGALTILFLLAGLIPVVGIAGTAGIFLVGSYFVGFNMMDYFHERHRKTVSESANTVWQRKGFALAIGMVFSGIMFVPLLGVLIAPMLAVTACSIGLTREWKGLEEKKV